MQSDKAKKKMLKRLRGRKCHHKCEIHGEPCTVVLRYKDKGIQRTVDALRAISGAPLHDENSQHYCELCALAMRQNRSLDSFARNDKGVVYIKNAGKSRFFENDEGELEMVEEE
jgi:hypothetical protein